MDDESNVNRSGQCVRETNRAKRHRWRYRPEVGPQPPLIYLGGDLGLGDGMPWIDFADVTGRRYVTHSVENVLRVADLFQEPGRSSLLAAAASHFGLSPFALLGPDVETNNKL